MTSYGAFCHARHNLSNFHHRPSAFSPPQHDAHVRLFKKISWLKFCIKEGWSQ